jgi:hypothetical protein
MAVQAPNARGAPDYTDGWSRVVDVIRWLLVAVLVVDVAAGLVAQPRESFLHDLHHELTAGTVRSVTFVEHDDLRFLILSTGRFRSDEIGPAVLWRVGPVDYRIANLRNGSPFLLSGGDSQPGEDQLRRQISRVAGEHGVPVHSGGRDLLLRFPQTGSAVCLLLLVVLLFGGQPRLATRWATFWLLLTPMNIGMVRTLVREAPWSAEMRAWPEPPPHRWMPHDQRLTGGRAFILMLLSYFAVDVALAVLESLRW